MAVLDDLISQVPDRVLRERLQRAVGDLRKRKKFGLIFEEHIPETTAIYGLPIQPGSLVQLRQDLEATRLFKVVGFSKNPKEAIIEDEKGRRETVGVRDPLVVKRFGEPMYAALTPLSIVHRSHKDRPHHAVVNGENFHSLKLFAYLLQRSVDCIYIDPPYNTGARDWKYNNRFVDSNDAWRHSKWLAMMEKRLRLARKLLRPDGVLICTVDHNEVHHLGMLLEQLFPEYLRYMITMVINPKGREKANFAPVDEYVFFVVPDIGQDVIVPVLLEGASVPQLPLDFLDDEPEELDSGEGDESEEMDAPSGTAEQWEFRHARRRGGGAESSSYRQERPHQFYPIYIDEKHRKVIRVGKAIPPDAAPDFRRVNGFRPLWPIDAEGRHRVWAFVPESMQRLIDAGHVFLGKYHPKRDDWTLKYRVPKKNWRKRKTVWLSKAYDAGTHGTELLKAFLGQPGLFPFPKSVYAVRDCLAAVVRNRPNALVLDFFAGSGTTLHAICLLNAADGGTRRCILVTNNEVEENLARSLVASGHYPGDQEYERHGIFEAVTRPRVQAVVTGRRPDGKPVRGKHVWAGGRPYAEGFEENVEFFKLGYLDPDAVELGEQFEDILPALWLAAGGISQRDDVPKTPVDYFLPNHSPFAVLFRVSRLRKFLGELEKRRDVTHVWVVTDSEEAYAEACAALPSHVRHTSQLYRDYLRTFRLNAEPK